jgi:hypothetical protein
MLGANNAPDIFRQAVSFMAAHYRILVAEQLASHWSDWFNGLTIAADENGATTLTGPIGDQAALYGILSKARDLNLTLLALNRCESNTESGSQTISGGQNEKYTL